MNPIDEMIFTRDAAGLIETMTDRFGVHRYQHDGLGRLTKADHPNAAGTSRGTSPVPDESYTYDPVGNRLASHRSSSYTYSYQLGQGGYQLRQDDDWDYTYDDNGSMVERRSRVGSVAVPASTIETMTYGRTGRMTSYTKTVNGAVELTYVLKYDIARNLRQTVVTAGVAALAITITRNYTQDGGPGAANVQLATDTAGTVLQRFLHTPQLDGALAEADGGANGNIADASKIGWLMSDQVNTVRAIMHGMGAMAATTYFARDSFGEFYGASQTGLADSFTLPLTGPLNNPGAGWPTGFGTSLTGFAGALAGPHPEWINLRARTYLPGLGRFGGEDLLRPFRFGYPPPLFARDPTGSVIERAVVKSLVTKAAIYGACFIGAAIAVFFLFQSLSYQEIQELEEHRTGQFDYESRLYKNAYRALAAVTGGAVVLGCVQVGGKTAFEWILHLLSGA